MYVLRTIPISYKRVQMIKIDFTDGYVCGEPGPNFYWYGTTEDFLELSCKLYTLGKNEGNRIVIPCTFQGKKSEVHMLSKKNGKILNRYLSSENKVLMELDITIWREILIKIYLLSMIPGREYIDLEEFQNLSEEANFIINSQYNLKEG